MSGDLLSTQADGVRVWNPHAEPYAPDTLADVLGMLGEGWDLDRVVEEYPHVIVFALDPEAVSA